MGGSGDEKSAHSNVTVMMERVTPPDDHHQIKCQYFRAIPSDFNESLSHDTFIL